MSEVTKGVIGIRAACGKYAVNRNTLKNWMDNICLPNLADTIVDEPPSPMPVNQSGDPPNRQLKALINALAEAELKISGLQTMIEVAEQEFNIKIRKKAWYQTVKPSIYAIPVRLILHYLVDGTSSGAHLREASGTPNTCLILICGQPACFKATHR